MSLQCPPKSLPVNERNNHPIQVAPKVVYEDGATPPLVSGGASLINVASAEITPPPGAMIAIINVFDTGTTNQNVFKLGDNATLDGSGTGKGFYKTQGEIRVACAAGRHIFLAKIGNNMDIFVSFESTET